MIAVQSEPIDVGAVLAAVQSSGDGGVVLFLGRVRDEARGRAVRQLDYEAYGGMALAELRALHGQALAQHGAGQVALVHRTGRLAVGDIAVAIAVSAPHRAQAFAACQWLIDTLKQRVPIWKKEWYADGEEWVSDRP
jgi:molybdopterin synthase catalytic subunit